MNATPDLLDAIVAATRARVDAAMEREPRELLERRAAARKPDGAAFRERLSREGSINVIAECKRRSPSRGILRAEYDPVAIARCYEKAGAAAISVLTESSFFDGALDHLSQVRETVGCPLLRKDFLIDDYQLLEARAAGADGVLLIVAALDDEELRRLRVAAERLQLAVLVEVHTREELDRAVQAGAAIIGVNSRNLRTLDVSLDATLEMARHLPASVTAVAESGIRSSEDLVTLRAGGYHAFLVGERLMTAADPGAALAQLLEGAPR